MFKCPSEDTERPVTTAVFISMHTYHNGGTATVTGYIYNIRTTPAAQNLGRTNYVGVAGTGSGNSAYWREWDGLFANRTESNLGQLANQDGSSNTMMFGELIGRTNGSDQNAYSMSWMGVGVMWAVRGTPGDPFGRWSAFSSRHTSSTNFCFGDGSVRGVKQDGSLNVVRAGNWELFMRLSGMRDGKTVDQAILLVN
jgi:prepilin-type processing-associated H-X9-DG protein